MTVGQAFPNERSSWSGEVPRSRRRRTARLAGDRHHLAAPRLIGYFNESVGGWRNGHLYLADSNLDWGQDLLRLEELLRREPPASRCGWGWPAIRRCPAALPSYLPAGCSATATGPIRRRSPAGST